MNIRNERGLWWFPIGIFLLGCLGLKGVEKLDHEVINVEKYKTHDTNFVAQNIEWVPKYSKELKIDTTMQHDSHGLPPGVRVDTEYKAPVE